MLTNVHIVIVICTRLHISCKYKAIILVVVLSPSIAKVDDYCVDQSDVTDCFSVSAERVCVRFD